MAQSNLLQLVKTNDKCVDVTNVLVSAVVLAQQLRMKRRTERILLM